MGGLSILNGDGGGVDGEEGRCQLGTEPEERREGKLWSECKINEKY